MAELGDHSVQRVGYRHQRVDDYSYESVRSTASLAAMKAITKGCKHFPDEKSAREWLSAKVLEPSFALARIEPMVSHASIISPVWRVEWGERNEERPDA